MKAFCFDPTIAQVFGVDAAVMLWNLDFWIQKNRANGHHFHDGYYWTYNSAKAFAELFPFWTSSQIRRILSKLENAGVIITGNYNTSSYDRTMWYAIDYEALFDAVCENDKSICRNRQMENTESQNGNSESDTPIPDSNADINTDSEQIIEARKARKPRKTSENCCLFVNSKFSDFDAFAENFNCDDYAGVDIRYYYEAVKNWSASNGIRRYDWIATARKFMQRDNQNGKLVRQKTNGLTAGELAYLQMGWEADELFK